MTKPVKDLSRRDFLKKGSLGLAALGLGTQLSQVKALNKVQNDDLHFLNRVSYGARPEDLAHLKAIGKEAYLDEQLNPDRIEDELADTKLARLPVLNMDRQTIYELDNPEDRASRSLIKGFLLRGIHSRKQLLERVVEFWTDHFHVPLAFDNNPDLVQLHRAMRQHAFGDFRDLLIASAKSPAMLVYLDNAYSSKDNPNENYARELLELHTLGVDGGYSEDDVKEIAKAFTGWTLHDRTKSGFYFDGEQHDQEKKVVLGYVLPEGRGIEDGLQVLSMLAAHPSTARFICTKLCIKFVSDQPPESLVESLINVWTAEKGNIKAVLRALFLSNEFAASQDQKFRRPLDFFIAASRATGSEILDWWSLQETLEELGQAPYAWEPPNGYPEASAVWMSTNSLLSRWNVATRLTHAAHSDPNEGWGYLTDLHERIPKVKTAGELVNAVSEQVFGTVLSDETLEPFVDYASDGMGASEPATGFLVGRKVASLYGLMLSSPQFQWR